MQEHLETALVTNGFYFLQSTANLTNAHWLDLVMRVLLIRVPEICCFKPKCKAWHIYKKETSLNTIAKYQNTKNCQKLSKLPVFFIINSNYKTFETCRPANIKNVTSSGQPVHWCVKVQYNLYINFALLCNISVFGLGGFKTEGRPLLKAQLPLPSSGPVMRGKCCSQTLLWWKCPQLWVSSATRTDTVLCVTRQLV